MGSAPRKRERRGGSRTAPMGIKLRKKVVKGIQLGIVELSNQTNQGVSHNEYSRNYGKHKRAVNE
jgi:hypothetical protein